MCSVLEVERKNARRGEKMDSRSQGTDSRRRRRIEIAAAGDIREAVILEEEEKN
jgi:hypothetical protein